MRRAICDALKLRPLTTKQLCDAFAELDRCTVMQHLKVLEEAGLVVPLRKGRERFNHLDAMPIQAIHERWIGPHAAGAARAAAAEAGAGGPGKENRTARLAPIACPAPAAG